MRKTVAEIRRRRVIPVALYYVVGAWLILEVADILLLAVMSLALLAIGFWLIDRMLRDAPALPSGPPNSVAVPAFEATEEERPARDRSHRAADQRTGGAGAPHRGDGSRLPRDIR